MSPTNEEGGTINFWQEPAGYWSASVRMAMPGQEDWKSSASGFHDPGEAIEWATVQVGMAVGDG